MVYWKYVFFKNGISPKEFNKCKISDIKDIMDIHNTFISKQNRTAAINQLMGQM